MILPLGSQTIAEELLCGKLGFILTSFSTGRLVSSSGEKIFCCVFLERLEIKVSSFPLSVFKKNNNLVTIDNVKYLSLVPSFSLAMLAGTEGGMILVLSFSGLNNCFL